MVIKGGSTVNAYKAEEKNNTSAYLFFDFVCVDSAPLLHHGQTQICRNSQHLLKLQSAQTFKKECLKDFKKKKKVVKLFTQFFTFEVPTKLEIAVWAAEVFYYFST